MNILIITACRYRMENSNDQENLSWCCELAEIKKIYGVRSVFLDISKVFDKVWHDEIVSKLTQKGISGWYNLA